MRKVLDIVIQARDESKKTQEIFKNLFAKNKKIIERGITGFELKKHEAKLQEESGNKNRKKNGI